VVAGTSTTLSTAGLSQDRQSLGMRSYLTVMAGGLSYVAAPKWLAT
jgi:hypothetical protein